VGLGSIWRFPYLAGVGGGGAFIIVFALACVVVATPLLVAEFALGRSSRSSPPDAAGKVAVDHGLSRRWNVIGILGSLAGVLIFSYYSMIAGWVLAYTWKCALGTLSQAGPAHVASLWATFRADPIQVSAWQAVFACLVAIISSRGRRNGIEAANKFRAPALLILLLILAAYALFAGNISRGFSFAFTPNFAAITPQMVIAAIGQAFYATGVGQAMMIAHGSYLESNTSLARTSLAITGSILLVSLLATVIVFPLVFGYGLSPAQGPELVFEVLPRAFTEMPAGRLIGTLFFALLILAALMPSVALLEPSVAWLVQHKGFSRGQAVWGTVTVCWILGIASVLSLSRWSSWYPLSFVPGLNRKTWFDLIDYASSNVVMPLGAVLTSALVGWRLEPAFLRDQLGDAPSTAQTACVWLLRLACPLAILAVIIASAL
jgi:neurotransmitter:Na+ symporter, NSS family